MPVFHPLHAPQDLPEVMNNPFDYTPHPLCLQAREQLLRILRGDTEGLPPEAREEIGRGKMFGILLVSRTTAHGEETGYLCAYSGQIRGRADWPGFVPAVFDYLQPDGYFKTHEQEITHINQSIERLQRNEGITAAQRMAEELNKTRQQLIAQHQEKMRAAKEARDSKRATGRLTAEEEAALIRESQFMKAELRRLKQSLLMPTDLERQLTTWQEDIDRLKRLRRQLSDDLQQWLFAQFRMRNHQGQEKDLLDIFAHTALRIPPAGSGECCEPRLLQYAYQHDMRPLQMAMFWWGDSPKEEIRHHLHFYPACQGKCKPILQWMLPADVLRPAKRKDHQEAQVCYEDHEIAIVYKPSGLLSVPGKTDAHSVYSLMRSRYPHATGPLIVHRLDQDTSGLMVIALTEYAYRQLQAQFEKHEVRKRYIALVTPASQDSPLYRQDRGIIDLPLSPDYLDRPRQRVDFTQGKTAITRYEVLARDDAQQTFRLALYPQTGRTHQLRMHCAHPQGLHAPIIGDPLYGTVVAPRMCLHAERITLVHPVTLEEKTWGMACPF